MHAKLKRINQAKLSVLAPHGNELVNGEKAYIPRNNGLRAFRTLKKTRTKLKRSLRVLRRREGEVKRFKINALEKLTYSTWTATIAERTRFVGRASSDSLTDRPTDHIERARTRIRGAEMPLQRRVPLGRPATSELHRDGA